VVGREFVVFGRDMPTLLILSKNRSIGGPFKIAEYVAQDSWLGFRSFNRDHGGAINPQWPMAVPLML